MGDVIDFPSGDDLEREKRRRRPLPTWQIALIAILAGFALGSIYAVTRTDE